uniref:REC8 meiotic recombination protein b n=1 Tax=Cyclopterus lumpus TaxID=8103 RepID=A0A8C2XHH1_CYCLU
MFYYPNVLQRHSGCFSTVCGDVLDYVTDQVPPPQPNLPRPRFSLYLSSQLQYGVVVVYHKQCDFLLEEAQHTINRLLRSKRCIYIDIAQSDRLTLDVPDSMYMMEEAEGAHNPFFGLMESHQLPSPYKIQSLPAAISLKEKEQFGITAAEYFEGDDLPEATAREIDLLMDQQDHFHKGVPGAERDTVRLLNDESGHPAEVPQAAVALEMTPLQVAMPTPPSRMVAAPLRKPGRGRRRQLVFADPQVQISERTMKEQIVNRLAETLKLVHETPVVDGMLDMSKEDKSVSDAITPASRWSPQEEAQLRMEPIAEENVDMPEAQNEAEDMLRYFIQFGEITFDSLMPPEADRTTAAHTLYKLLGEEIKSCFFLVPVRHLICIYD